MSSVAESLNFTIEVMDEDTLEVIFTAGSGIIGVLSIKKTPVGWLHHFSWREGSDFQIFTKLLGDYSENTRSYGFKFFYRVISKAVGFKLDLGEFRRKIWEPLLKCLNSDEKYHRFKKDAVTAEIRYLREITRKLVIYTRDGKEESFPVDLIVEFNGGERKLRLTSTSVRDPNKVIEGFLKEFGEFPDELIEISRKEWNRLIINRMKQEGKLEFRKIEESDESLMAETVLNFLRNARVTTDRSEVLIDENSVFYDGESLIVPSKTIRSMLLLAGYNRFSWNQLRDILSNFIKKNTDAVRFDGKTVLKCWFFDPEKVGVNVKEQLEGGNDGSDA